MWEDGNKERSVALKYTIKKGDTLSQIAKDNNTTVSELTKVNNIANPNLIYAGATIEIPTQTETKTASVNNTQESSTTSDYSSPYYESGKPVYTVGSDVKQAQESLKNWENSKPDEYKSAYSSSISAVLDKILNREAFSYDFNADPIYRQYRERYVNDGKKAMKDTMGNAAALTGGYGNSYAASAGNAAYNSYLEKLGDIVPSLLEAAYKRYSDGLQKDRSDLDTLLGLDETDYSRYRNGIDDYKDEGEYLFKKLTEISDVDYSRFLDEIEQWNTDREYGRSVYEDERDAQYKKERDAVADSKWEKEYALALQKLAAANSASSSSGKKVNSSTSSADTETVNKNTKKSISYRSCGSKAREFLDLLAYPESYDSKGYLKEEIRLALAQAKKDGEITSEEYSYIINSVN